ncbi:IS110 family transposase [Dysosmobacter sp.]|uniref:IS110 family transposase n=1 Tax=Dysosmobacter sp. TaxID=2591382 RepID=UPI002A9C102D|nr:IS110 family transposase [Dysosmobacter sp.]MDY5613144.1 IS110 family transposase [Dysosmobacter sp.]
MNSVGIDISKGRSTIAVMRPFGEVVLSPFEVCHTDSELSALAGRLKSLNGETRVLMEATGNYHLPVAHALHDAGLYVSVVNAKLVHGYGNNDLRRVKTDRKDAVKLANYGLSCWLTLPRYVPEEDIRLLLKNCYRQYRQYSKVQTVLKNNLISLLDTTFPNANRLFNSPARADGSEKWVDFVAEFWHCKCICEYSEKMFVNKYQRWCRKHGYNFSEEKARDIYSEACECVGVIPKSGTARLLVEQAVSQLRATSSALAALKQEMQALAAQLPEYPVVMGMFGVGPTLGPQLMAEIGDVRRFSSKKALVAYAGINAPPNDSGDVTGRHKGMSKVGASSLRRTLFLVMSVYLQNSPPDEPVYRFMDRKRAEGKPYRVYMMASANKFLRIYYATVKAYLDKLKQI